MVYPILDAIPIPLCAISSEGTPAILDIKLWNTFNNASARGNIINAHIKLTAHPPDIGRKFKYTKNKKAYTNCIKALTNISPNQSDAPIALRFIIHKVATTGVNIVKTNKVKCLIKNLIFNLTNRYANIQITRAVNIAFPVLIFERIELPSKSLRLPPFACKTNIFTRLLFK